MRVRTRWIAGLSAATILLISAVTVFGYQGQVEAIVGVATQGSVTCNAPFTMTATIMDANGAPVSGASVSWSFVASPSTGDRINSTPTMTNAAGVATTTVTLAAANGERRIRATAGDASGSAVFTAVCGGLPETSTLPSASPSRGEPVAVLLLLGVAFVAGGVLALRRLALGRR